MGKLSLGKLAPDPRSHPVVPAFGARVCWLRNLPRHQPGAGKEGSKARAYLIPPWGENRFVPAPDCLSGPRGPAGDAPTAQKGTLRRPVTGPPQEALWRAGEGFPPFHNDPPSPLARSNGTAGGRFLRSGPSHSPGAQWQPETRHSDPGAAPALGRRTLIPFRRQRLTPPAGRERTHNQIPCIWQR